MGTSVVVSEMTTLMRDHPYISCSLLIFLTPPFFPILKFFSPLLISTALFIVALVTMGPQFDPQEDEQGQSGEPDHHTRTVVGDGHTTHRSAKMQFSPGDWIKSCKESGLAWVEHKVFRNNNNWRASSLNDENVSILQEAFAHRALEVTPHVMVKLVTRRIPAEDEDFSFEPHVSKDHSFDRRPSKDQSFDRRASNDQSLHRRASRDSGFHERDASRDDFEGHSLDRGGFHERHGSRGLPHDIFSPHPSLSSRRHDADGGPLFENHAGPPPIEYDMPPLVTGPAAAPVSFRSFEDDSDDDLYDHHHDEHMHLEVGERSLESPVRSGGGTLYDQPPPFTVQEEDLPSSSDEEEERTYFKEWQQRIKEAAESSQDHAPAAHDRDIPELEDEVHVEKEEAPVAAAPGETSTWKEFVSEAKSSDHLGAEPVDGHVDAAPGDHLDAKPADTGDQFDEQSRDVHFEAESAGDSHFDAKPAGDVHLDAVPDHVTEAPSTDHVSEELPAAEAEDAAVSMALHHHEQPVHHSFDRSMSLPVMGHPEMDITPDEDELEKPHEEQQVERPPHEEQPTRYTLSNAISLPSKRASLAPIVIPPKTREEVMGPRSPDTDLGYATSPEHRHFHRYNSLTTISADESELTLPIIRPLSTREKLTNLEALCNSMDRSSCPTPVAILRATTAEQVTHVTDKLKDFLEDSPLKKFQADAPQLQITPPSSKVPMPPSKSAILASALGRPSILSASSRARYGGARYSSSDEDSEDEQIDLDSDVEEGEAGEDSDSEIEIVEVGGKSRIKPPPKPPGEIVKSRT